MNVKGSAAGELSQCIPLTAFSLGLTGDINAVMNAHNLAMVALRPACNMNLMPAMLF